MIFYFSGTGNTRWAAELLAKTTDEKLLYIPDEMRAGRHEYTLAEDERIGFCFPTHGWQPPRVVREFIRSLRINKTTEEPFCYALTTCGDSTGETMSILNKELARIGLKAETMFSIIMPESYVCLPFMYTDSDERETEKIENAKHQMAYIADIVKDRKRGIEGLEKGATPRLYSYVIGSYFNNRMITDKKFTVDTEACINCGKCASVCPTGNIAFDEHPTWKHDGSCTCCLACYHYCPRHAINYGRITRRRGQYYFGHNTTKDK